MAIQQRALQRKTQPSLVKIRQPRNAGEGCVFCCQQAVPLAEVFISDFRILSCEEVLAQRRRPGECQRERGDSDTRP